MLNYPNGKKVVKDVTSESNGPHNLTIIIGEKLPNGNDYSTAQRTNCHVGAKFKKDWQNIVTSYLRSQIKRDLNLKRINIAFTFYEPNKKRDFDNIESFAKKVIFDALQVWGVIANDNWKCIAQPIPVSFYVDKDNPRIEVEIREVRE